MRMPLKIGLSLFLTAIIFSFFIVIAYSSVFDYVETRFYRDGINDTLDNQLENRISEINGYYNEIISFATEITLNDSIVNSFLPNVSLQDQFNNDSIVTELTKRYPFFKHFRIIEIIDDQARLHYSNRPGDVKRESANTRTYKRLNELEDSDYVEIINSGDTVIQRKDDSEFLFIINVDNVPGGADGYVVLHFAEEGLEYYLKEVKNLPGGTNVFIWENCYILSDLNLDNVDKEDLFQQYFHQTVKSFQVENFRKDNDTHYLLAYGYSKDVGFVGYTIENSIFHISNDLKVVLTVLMAVTVFLLLFVLFNIRQDRLSVIQSRLRKMQINLFTEFVKNREKIDWNRWSKDVERKRNFINERVLKSTKKLKKAEVLEIENFLEKSWDDFLRLINAEHDNRSHGIVSDSSLEELLRKVLSDQQIRANLTVDSRATVQPVKSAPLQKKSITEDLDSRRISSGQESAGELGKLDETEEVEELDELSEAEEVEELDELSEAEEVEELDELSEAEEVEELDELSEVEEVEELHELSEVEEVEKLDELSEVEEIEELDEVAEAEEVEELDELSEVEEVEELDEVAEAEEIEELDELSEAEEIEELDELEEVEAIEELDELEEAEEVEELDELAEAEEVEELDELSEAEEVEELDELTEAEEVEELDEVEEAEEIDEVEEAEEIDELDEVVDLENVEEFEEPGPIKPIDNDAFTDIDDYNDDIDHIVQDDDVEDLEIVERLRQEKKKQDSVDSENIDTMYPVPLAAEPFESLEELNLVDQDVKDMVYSLDSYEGVNYSYLYPESFGYSAITDMQIAIIGEIDEIVISSDKVDESNVDNIDEFEDLEPIDAEPFELTLQEEDFIDLVEIFSLGDDIADIEIFDEIDEVSPNKMVEISMGSKQHDFSNIDDIEELEEIEDVEDLDVEEDLEVLEDVEPLEEIDAIDEQAGSSPDLSAVINRMSEQGKFECALFWDDLAIDEEETDSVITLEDGVFQLKEGHASDVKETKNPEFKGLVDSVLKKTESGTSEEVSILSVTSVDLGFEPVTQKKIEKNPAISRSAEISRYGFDYDNYLLSFKKGVIGLSKSLMRVSQRVNALYAAILRREGDVLKVANNIGMAEESQDRFKLDCHSEFYTDYLEKGQAVLFKAKYLGYPPIDNLLDPKDRSFLEAYLFIPVIYENICTYMFFGLKDCDSDLETLIRKLK